MKTTLRITEAGKTLYCVELYVEEGEKKHLSFRIFVDKVEIDTRIIEGIMDYLAEKCLKEIIELVKTTKRGCKDGKNIN